jgi:threonine dehydrogenase-like Zn-dependent dehydrogenase
VVLKFLASNRLHVTELITHRISYQDAADIYRRLMDYERGMMGIVLDWLA